MTAECGVILIFDEVMTSRLGPGGYQGVCGVAPDMMSLGKYVGGGLTFGAFGGKAAIMEHFDPSKPGHLSHAGTFNNNVLTMAAAIVGLRDIYTLEKAIAMNEAGNALRTRLNGTLAKHGIAGQITGYGSMMMLHLTDGELTGPTDQCQGQRLRPWPVPPRYDRARLLRGKAQHDGPLVAHGRGRV